MVHKRPSTLCTTCRFIDDVQHCVMECVQISSIRIKSVTKFNLNKLDVGMFYRILGNPSYDVAKILYDMSERLFYDRRCTKEFDYSIIRL